ncbi:CotH kinase family protein [Herpetosiphon llansteffanensis]|uniref:CotH kinase family protein n=1 Tax=Herpetosiphon llansteffanensis TaxID=2094568 RepID=UPI000D7C304F|nr:CotH kinase family protein [Herpetosiphon llansteffanensis]
MKFWRWLCLVAVGLNLAACTASSTATVVPAEATVVAGVTRPAGWNEASHGESAEPNYAVVFPQNAVNQLTITIDSASWQAMQANMTELFGEPGSRQMGGGFPGGVFTDTNGLPMRPVGAFTDTNGMPGGFPGGVFTDTNGMPGGFPSGVFTDTQRMPGGMPNMGDLVTENPMLVTATLSFEGQTWTNVGVRYKGNSSLMNAWNSQQSNLPFKLDFDQFEKTYPDIDNQRFYGFKQLALANNLGDLTAMRETIAYDLFAQMGLPAAETATYEVLLDHVNGVESLGLYTAVEVIDDTAIARVFGDDSGNIYEGDGSAASLAEGSKAAIQESFQKENNDTTGWADVEALYDVLHSSERTSNPAAWRAKLEAVFDVPSFLKWLGVSTLLEHWDTYGAMTHNYYLYNNPATGKLTWVSWDHNFVLGASMGGGRNQAPAGMQNNPNQPANGNNQALPNNPNRPANGGEMRGPGGGFGGQNNTFDKASVTSDWPLIRYLLDDPTYYTAYIAALRETSSQFDAEALVQKYTALAATISPSAIQKTSVDEYNAAVTSLMERIRTRSSDLKTFLATQ